MRQRLRAYRLRNGPNVAATLRKSAGDATIARLRSEIEARDRLISAQDQALRHSQKIFQKSSEAARIGVWECELPSEALTWTDLVYDLFDLPRGAALVREEIVACYTPQSAIELERLRNQAIATQTGFTLDAQIVTFHGARRWIRITASVESENGRPVRIFGMKQDITEEKRLWRRMIYLAEYDVMTGLANRSRFQARLAEIDNGPDGPRPVGALMLVDLDDFKLVNDTFGHARGDACLREAARLLVESCPGAELVARIGGDEFAVLFASAIRCEDVGAAAQRIVSAMRRMTVESDGTGPGASVGIACGRGLSGEQMFLRADMALYAAKAAGRGVYRFAEDIETQARPSRGTSDPPASLRR